MNNFQNPQHGIKLAIDQMPNADNDHIAVVTATVHKEIGVFSGIGVGQPDNQNEPVDCQSLFDNASQAAIHNAKQLAGVSMGNGKNTSGSNSRQSSTRTMGHRTEAGSNSPRQRAVLEDIAARNDTTLDDIAREKFGIPARNLSSDQANVLIQKYANR